MSHLYAFGSGCAAGLALCSASGRYVPLAVVMATLSALFGLVARRLKREEASRG